MPVKMTTLPSGKVQVRTPGGIKAKGTSRKKAEAQRRLLYGIDKGWVPRGIKK
jgi:hypothetical protein